ncbi:Crp/Fnr family transcriptional regulator [Motilibacter aurantiacus]|uniref:Crp/Fnr family transcriptional regulator n=1 Tax=Motilibacter aurantiacus TaxID=2714955 RepID=UPI00140C763F|nr:cyclic nucleotide-binding domain-containing protein [Motilibacter aurantiacus]NHC45591.1 cyclic nucleotide-binding domain-containing protein [Motilibacter aurantiacus]
MDGPGGTLLADASEEEWAAVFTHAHLLRYAPGEVIADVGEDDESVYVVVQGDVEVLVPAEGTQGLTLVDELEAGNVFGEVSFLDGEPRSAQVRAASDVVLAGLDHEGFDRLSAAHPALAIRLLLDLGRILAGRLRAAERRPG